MSAACASNTAVKAIIIDLFCGAGGMTQGISGVPGCKVIACVNHDPTAIKSHAENHPECEHFTEDVRDPNLLIKLKTIVEQARQLYPKAKLWIHASLECIHFSNAKGGDSRNNDSRTLAYVLYEYQKALDPDMITIENVREFMSFGPLIIKQVKDRCPLKYTKVISHKEPTQRGKRIVLKTIYKYDIGPVWIPESKTAGKYYQEWLSTLCKLGDYEHEYKILNSANFGAMQRRTRYFCVFYKKGMQIAWPKQTHAEKPKKSNGTLFDDQLLPWNGCAPALDLNDPGTSIFAKKKPPVDKSLIRIIDGIKKYGKDPEIYTVYDTTKNKLLRGEFMQTYYSPGRTFKLSAPAHTITTDDHHCKVSFLAIHNGTSLSTGIRKPIPTITTNHRFAKVVLAINNLHGVGSFTPVKKPALAVLTSDTKQLAALFITNDSYSNGPTSIHKPCVTVISQQGSKPLRLNIAVLNNHSEHWTPKPGDTKVMIELRKLMKEFKIVDIYTRMLNYKELMLLQGFPSTYKLSGSADKKKWMIGNAVEVTTAENLASSWTKFL